MLRPSRIPALVMAVGCRMLSGKREGWPVADCSWKLRERKGAKDRVQSAPAITPAVAVIGSVLLIFEFVAARKR